MVKIINFIGRLMDFSSIWSDTPEDRATRRISKILNTGTKAEQKAIFNKILAKGRP